jgi:tetratricopeptide (TPR) repeat protein
MCPVTRSRSWAWPQSVNLTHQSFEPCHNLGEEDAPQLLSPRYDPKTVKFSVSQSARTINSNQPKTVIDQRGQIVTTQYNAETQYNVQNLNVTNLTQLDAIDQTVKRNLISAYEAQIRKTPEQAKYHLALGLFYLDLRLYTRAIKWLEEAHTKDPLNPNALYYLALACVEGKPPRILKESTVELIESYLDAAIRLDSSKPHFYYLWALIKYDFYFENGYTTTPQETEELLDIANQLEPNYREIELMLSHVPIPDDSRMAETLSRKPTSSRSQKQTWSFFRR